MPATNDKFVNNEQYEVDKADFLRVSEREKFADAFALAAEKQSVIKETINKLILDSISLDHETRKELSKLICSTLKDESLAFWKKFGLAIWTIVVAVISPIVVFFIINLIKIYK